MPCCRVQYSPAPTDRERVYIVPVDTYSTYIAFPEGKGCEEVRGVSKREGRGEGEEGRGGTHAGREREGEGGNTNTSGREKGDGWGIKTSASEEWGGGRKEPRGLTLAFLM